MIDKLEYLVALAQEKHFGRAAESCSVSQPSLSLGLKHLEETLGVLLVQRGSRFIGLTPEGQRTLEWARRIVGDTRAMRQEIKALKHGLAGRMRIAVIPAALPMATIVTQPFSVRHPDVQFTILSRPSSDISALLENFDIDAAITYVDFDPMTKVTAIPLYRERYQLLVTKESPLAQLKTITWADVSKLPLCLLTLDTQNRRIIEGMLRGTGGTPNVTLESDSMSILFAHVRTGAWMSVIPDKVIETSHLTTKDFSAIPITEPDIAHTIGVVMPLRSPTTPLATAFAAEARRASQDLLTH
ncbi:MAG: LysR family transcriptional regulator [Pseudolabrys sp.]|nr:LysR family transcriptional regulator [Pseudolabrys sp.]